MRLGYVHGLSTLILSLLLGWVPFGAAAAPLLQPDPGSPAIALELVTDQLLQPVYVTHAGDGSGRLFVVEKKGRVVTLREGAPEAKPFLDISALVASEATEQGLLSIAFHPGFSSNGQFYLAYSDLSNNLAIVRYRVVEGDPELANPESSETVLYLEHPARDRRDLRHYGGFLQFGPDGYLYVSLGDQSTNGHQKQTDLRGKLLRLDVDGGSPYAVPPDNPFVGRQNARPEIWAYGLRNPWRFSFDQATGDLYIADVGRNKWEEINLQRAGSGGGQNYGWDKMEGTHCHAWRQSEEGLPCDTNGFEQPIAEYDHTQGCAVIGGQVYRGSNFPQFIGLYFFADYCAGRIWSLQEQAPGEWRQEELMKAPFFISSFGQSETGDLYVTSTSTNSLYRLGAAP
jgi:glucose/arabinose dehydrogenase